MIEGGKHQAVGEEDRVIEESLANHEREPEQRARGVIFQHGSYNSAIAYGSGRANQHSPLRLRQGGDMLFFHDFALDHAHDLVRLVEPSMHHKPARAFRHETPYGQNC